MMFKDKCPVCYAREINGTLRTYDGYTTRLEEQNVELKLAVREMGEALSECEGHFLSIELDYAAEVGNTPKMISKSAIASIRETLTKHADILKRGEE